MSKTWRLGFDQLRMKLCWCKIGTTKPYGTDLFLYSQILSNMLKKNGILSDTLNVLSGAPAYFDSSGTDY